MNELIILLTGVAVGAGGLLVILSIRGMRFDSPPVFIQGMIEYLGVVSLPPWSTGKTRSWLDQKFNERLAGSTRYSPYSDEQFIIQLFLELGREIETTDEVE